MHKHIIETGGAFETPRLIVLPLALGQLRLYLKNDGSLETDLHLVYFPRYISGELEEALLQTVIPNVATSADDPRLVTLWTMILKADNRMVGDICFYGPPDSTGQTEIGYGTYAEYQGKGLMTEAIQGMVEWLESQSNVKIVVATTDIANPSSMAVLTKNGFLNTHNENGQCFWSRRIIPPPTFPAEK